MTAHGRNALGVLLTIVFLLALVLGSGPGIRLVNVPVMVPLGGGFGLPALYVWALAWFAVEATCVVLLAVLVWRAPGEDGGGQRGGEA